MEKKTYNKLGLVIPEGFRVGTEEDLPLITLTIAQAFADCEYPVPSVPTSHSARLRLNYTIGECVVRNAFEFGTVLTNTDFSAVLIAVPLEHSCVLPLERIAAELEKNESKEAADNCYGIFSRVGEKEAELSFRDNTVYLEVFAVQTPRQGQKLGSMLMREMLRQCNLRGSDTLLFTNTERNQSIYHHFNFETILEDYSEELNSTTYFMLHRCDK